MKKLDSLRAWMTAGLPFLKRNPEALHLFADEGRIACTGNGGLSFEKRYRVTLQLWDFAGDEHAVMVPVLAWLGVYQRELLQSYRQNADAVTFRAEVLDGQKVDLELQFEISERVQVVRRPDGSGLDYQVLPEPFEDTGAMRHWTLWIGGDQVAEWDAPDGVAFP